MSGEWISPLNRSTAHINGTPYDKQIIGTFIGIDYFTSWKECGHFCETSPECEFWTIGGIDSYPDGCTIYSASYELRQHAGAISGSKSCH